jgi:hypothetical protein
MHHILRPALRSCRASAWLWLGGTGYANQGYGGSARKVFLQERTSTRVWAVRAEMDRQTISNVKFANPEILGRVSDIFIMRRAHIYKANNHNTLQQIITICAYLCAYYSVIFATTFVTLTGKIRPLLCGRLPLLRPFLQLIAYSLTPRNWRAPKLAETNLMGNV